MALERVLEAEVMDSEEDALEYGAIDNRAVNQEFVRYLTAELGFCGGRVLDLGTGPADIAIAIAELIPSADVVGADLAHSMLAVAERRVAASTARARIELRYADAKATGLPQGSFDLVICNSLVHHVPEPLGLFCEVARLCRPGAGLFIKDLRRPATLDELERLVAAHAANDTPYQRKLFYDSLHASLLPEEVQALAAQAGLRDVRVTVPSDRHWQLTRPMTIQTTTTRT